MKAHTIKKDHFSTTGKGIWNRFFRPLSIIWMLGMAAILLPGCPALQDVISDLDLELPELAWASNRDINSDQFSTKFDLYKSRGYMMIDVDAYPGSSGMLYSMVWKDNVDNRGWAEWRNLSSSAYNAKWTEYKDLGWRPSDVEGYMSGSNLLFAGIWVANPEGLDWKSYRNQTSSEFGDKFTELKDLGYRIVDIEAYQTPSGLRYASIWYENKLNLDWAEYRNMSRTQYQDRIDEFSGLGYRVIDFESYMSGSVQKYAAIWEKNLLNRAYAVRSDRTEVEFSNLWRQYRDEGYRLIDFERYPTPNGDRYAGVWTENASRFRWDKKSTVDGIIKTYQSNSGVTGISVAIIEDGKTLYKRGFGFADVDGNKTAHSETVYLMASISKVIGGTLATKLEAEGQLNDGTGVSLDMTNPTSDYISIPSSAGHTHTVEQLFSHTGCIWHYPTGPEPPIAYYSTASAAVQTIWDTAQLANCTPGVNRNYSTHGFTFAAAAIENAANRPIAQLIEEEISDPYNLSSMKVQYRFSTLRSESERAMPYDNSGNEITYADNSWKVLGGGIESDVIDLARFGWKTLNGEIVDANTRDNRLWTQVVPGLRNGVAWELRTTGGRRIAEHGGRWVGARSHLQVYRDDALVIAVLSNQRGHDPQALAASIANAVLN